MVFHVPSFKIRVTCVNVLLVVTICPSFQSSLCSLVHVIPTHYVQYGRHDILLEMKDLPILFVFPCSQSWSHLQSSK
jgi:hypothetical protein